MDAFRSDGVGWKLRAFAAPAGFGFGWLYVRLPVEIRRILQCVEHCLLETPQHAFRRGELTEREKSIMYLTLLEQNKHSVSRTSEFCSPLTFSGKRSEAVGTGNHNVRNSVGVFPVSRNPNRSRFRQMACCPRRGRVKQVSDTVQKTLGLILSLGKKCIGKHSDRNNSGSIGSAAGDH